VRKLPWEPVLIVLVVGVTFALLVHTIYGDGLGYYALTESLLDDGDLRLENNYRPGANAFFVSPNGRTVVEFPMGVAWMQAPFFMAAKIVGPDPTPDGGRYPFEARSRGELWRIVSVLLANCLYALTGVLLVFFTLVRLGFSRPLAAAATLATFFSSPVPYYGPSFYSHSANFFLMALCFSLLVRLVALQREDPRGTATTRWLPFALGLLLCLATHVRYGSSFVFLAVFAFVAWSAFEQRRLAPLAWLVAGYLSLFWVFPLYWKLQFGSFFALGYPTNFDWLTWPPPGIDSLLGAHHGYLLWFPLHAFSLVALALVALGGVSQVRRRTAVVSLLIVAAVAFIYGLRVKGDNPGDWGHRNMMAVTPMVAFGLACFYERVRTWVSVLVTFVTGGFSLALLLLGRARLATPHPELGNSSGNYLSDYLYVFEQGMSLPEVLQRLVAKTHLLPGLVAHPTATVLGVLAVAALFLVVTDGANGLTAGWRRRKTRPLRAPGWGARR